MLRYIKDYTGKINALKAMHDGSPVDDRAAPYLKGQTLYRYLIENNGIEGMLKREMPTTLVQRVLARCMKEKEKKEDEESAQGIWGFVEFLKSHVATNKEGIPHYIIEMGYEAHFPSKWARPTPKNVFNQMKPLMPYLPTLVSFQEAKAKKIDLEHTALSAAAATTASFAETPFDNYYNRLSNLVYSTEQGRYQEGLVFGCDILQCYPDGGERALQVYLHLATCGGALYSHALAKACLERANKMADSGNEYQCATIALFIQTIFKMWGCFEEESKVWAGGIKDTFSSIYIRSSIVHIEARFDVLIDTLAERCYIVCFHQSCPEECHSLALEAQRKTLCIIQDLKQMVTIKDNFYLAFLYTCEAADLVLQLRTNQNTTIYALTGAALFIAQLARKTRKNDPMLKALLAMLKFHSQLYTKKEFLLKVSKISQSMSKTTRTRNSLLSANVFYTQSVLMCILGPSGRHVKTFFQSALKTFQVATNHQHYRIHLMECMHSVVFGKLDHGSSGDNSNDLLATSPTHIIQSLAAQDIICGDEPHFGLKPSVESIICDSPHLIGSLAFGLESIKKRL